MTVDHTRRAAWHWDRADRARAAGEPQLATEHESAAGLCELLAHEDLTGTAA